MSCFPRERKGLFNLGQSLIMLPIALKHKNMEAAIMGKRSEHAYGFLPEFVRVKGMFWEDIPCWMMQHHFRCPDDFSLWAIRKIKST